MSDLEKSSKIWSPKAVEFGDSEAAKLCKILHDSKQSVDESLQQTVRSEKVKHGQFKGQDGNYIRLGPCFKPERVDEVLGSLKECFPADFTKSPYLNEPEKLKCDWLKSSGKPVNGWTSTIDTRQWFERLSSRHGQWRKLRIYELLKLSTYPAFPFYGSVTLGLLCCWNPCLNVFITGQGFKTISLEDIAFLTGLSPSGTDLPTQVLIDEALDMEKIAPWKNNTNMSFNIIVDSYNPDKNKSLSMEVSRKEEVLFINLALCKLMMFPSCNVNKTFLKLAANIEASGSDPKRTEPLCLAPLFLGQVYRCLYRLRTHDKLSTAGGPIWVISMWALFHFPHLVEQKDNEQKASLSKPSILPCTNYCCYGELAVHTVSPVAHLSFEEVLRGLLFPREATQSDWHVFYREDEMDIRSEKKFRTNTLGHSMKVAIPNWLQEISCMIFRERDQLYWSSILLSRDLICLEPQVIGVEVYNPNLVARQFGMTQGLAIPFYKTLNRPWGTRPNLLEMALKSTDNKYAFTETWLKAFPTYEVRSLNITPWFRQAEIDAGYEIWWIDYLKRCQPSWLKGFAALVQNIQGSLIVSSPSIEQASLSPWQNKQYRGARKPKSPFLRNLSQGKIFAHIPTFPPSVKAVVEESEECDDNTPLMILKQRHSAQSCQPSLLTSRRKRKYGFDPLVKGNSEVVSGVLNDIEHDISGDLLTSSDNPRKINIKEKKIAQNNEPDIFNVSLNFLKVLEKETVKEEATTPYLQQENSHATEVIPENLTKRNTVERPSMDPNEMILECQAVDHTSISPPRADDQPSMHVEPTGDLTSSAITSDISSAIVDGPSPSPEVLESLKKPSSPKGHCTYTPEKALAEVNSLVCLIEDSLRPAYLPSAFDIEKKNAEKILNILQCNMENLATYAELADQIQKLAVVSPSQFQPNLTHFKTIFLSSLDKLQDIKKNADRLNFNADNIHELNAAAKDLRDRIQGSRERIDQLEAECSVYDKEIEKLEAKLANLKQVRASKQQELTLEQQKFADFSSTWSVTIPSLQKQAKIMVTAQQMKAEHESTIKAVKTNVHSFLELLRTM
ncbi:uncharacterized protein LOC130797704 isoform X1 [Amaranthus tricolor]|uniref:uncharacterized protein LOC130797704 isoform X1 n=1 Tax=Amaranthus tricolor TaxID=29722 RepID=UPI00258E99E6|nr:uncharacterized protein LOC130797704 isoform X1 [Amaranthus tricolor]XP_057516395.1 uncharacterized protein LOC130797704 isoform X1 [Amaranthus tricolor]XP_057516396.1 uncharacterized protein LOC130797704 isoform X1 [Amaranthus tricolor]